MRTWLKNGIRFTVLATALAAMSAGVTYSQGSPDGSTLLTGQPGEQREMGGAGLTEPADDFTAGTGPVSRGRMAGLAAVAITAAGSIMLIRRLRRRGSGDGDEA
jgi:hypothetical protein